MIFGYTVAMQAFSAMISAAWRYSEGRRARLLLYVTMFVGANTVLLLETVVIGHLLNTIQQIATVSDPVRTLSMLFAMMVGIQFAFWSLHGPARVIERTNAFRAKAAFTDRLFHIVTSLPIQWHKDHHSGQTINRMRKSTPARS